MACLYLASTNIETNRIIYHIPIEIKSGCNGKKIDHMDLICLGGLHMVGQQGLKRKSHLGLIFDGTFCMVIYVKPA